MIGPTASVSGALVSHLVAIGQGWGVATDAPLQEAGIGPGSLADPETRIELRQAVALARRLMDLSGRDDLGLEWGLTAKMTLHGHIAYAIMSCATVGEAIKLIGSYKGSHFEAFAPTMFLDGQAVIVRIAPAAALGDQRRPYGEALIALICQHTRWLTGGGLEGWSLEVNWPPPPYVARYQDALPPCRFERTQTQIRFPRSFLATPMQLADPLAVRRALRQVDREQAEWRTARAANIVQRVRERLQAADNGFPRLGEVAAQLRLSERTLKRRLNAEGSCFQSLLDDIRLRRANALIIDRNVPLKEVARLVGYADPAVFTRAYKRWSHQTPSARRKGEP